MMLGSAAAALIGLQFVVIALIGNTRKLASMATINAFGTPTVTHLAGALILSAIMSAPWPSLGSAAVAVVVCGVGGLGYALIAIYRVCRQAGYEPDSEDWLWYAAVPCSLYGALGVAGSLLPTRSRVALFVVGGAALGLLLLGIRNSWDTITYVVADAPADDGTRQRPLNPPPA